MQQHKINLREERDFSQKINAVFTFLQQNFKPLFKSILFISGPSALIAGIFMGMYQSRVLSLVNDNLENMSRSRNPFLAQDIFTPSYFLAILFSVISFLLVFLTVFGYLAEYLENKDIDITPDRVWQHVKKHFFSSLFATLALGTLTVLSLFVLIGFYFAIAFQFALLIIVFEKSGFSGLISRCLFLVRNKWWSTFGLLVVIGIIQGVIGVVFSVPLYIMTFAKTFHLGGSTDNDLFVIGSTMFSTIGSTLLYSFSALAIAFQYFNLIERKEGVGLLAEVDQLGKNQSISANEGDF